MTGRRADQMWSERSTRSGTCIHERTAAIQMAKKNKTKDVTARRYRDSLTGRFVTRKHAKKNKKTTVKESISGA